MRLSSVLLRGIDHHRLGGVTDDNAREAVKWFTKAIEADTNYAAAYAWRVCATSWLPDFDFDWALRDIRKAIELDASDPESNRILGYIEFTKGNYEQAKALNLRAMQMNPTDAYLKARSASIMTYLGDPGFALSLVDEAEGLDPMLPVFCVEERGVALYALGRYQDALEALERLVFQTYRARLYRAASLVALDRTGEARKLTDEAVAGHPGVTIQRFVDKERYRDEAMRRVLWERLKLAGLPE
jgi:adenylate cyclase